MDSGGHNLFNKINVFNFMLWFGNQGFNSNLILSGVIRKTDSELKWGRGDEGIGWL